MPHRCAILSLIAAAAAYLPQRSSMRPTTRRHNAWPEKPPAHRDEPRDARDDEWAALLEESRASDPRLADRPAPRVERFTYGVDGADDRTMTLYGAAFTADDATPRPGVVLFHTAAGPRDRFVEWMAERLVAAGYTAVVADLYGDAWGSGWDAAWAAGPREQLKDPAVLAERAPAAIRCLQARPEVDAARCGALGWCLGGRAAVTLASMRPAGLRAAVSFHGVFDAECLREALQTDEPPPGLLLCHGLADPFVPAFDAAVAALVERSAQINFFAALLTPSTRRLLDAQVERGLPTFASCFPFAKHGFTNPAQALNSADAFAYDAVPAEAAWKRAEEELERLL